MKKIELLAPAGDPEKLKTAVDYGADAVYFGGEAYSLRAGAGNLSIPEMEEGLDYLHERGKKGYLTLNVFAHNEDVDGLEAYLRRIRHLPVDAWLVSDPGVMSVLLDVIPDAEIHLSTQANTTNYRTALFWYRQGVRRMVAAREMSMEELRRFRKEIPEDMELEVFVHGAMCISYSGRCLLSNFMAGRDANRGLCAHPCRWNYALMEEKRPGEYFPVEEDARGSYVFNSRDLCMIEYIPDLIESGIASAKIEGRMKSVFYVANIVRVYREAIDLYYADPSHYRYHPAWLEELGKVSNRRFTTGFFYGKADETSQNYESSSYIRNYQFIGVVRDYDPETGFAVIEQRNNFKKGQTIEIFGPGSADFSVQTISEMYDEENQPIEVAPHAQQMVRMKLDRPAAPGDMLRRKQETDAQGTITK